MNNDFLPSNYDVPSSAGNYMRFKDGENRFRVLASPIIGWEFWTESDGVRKPVRRRMNETISTSECDPSDVKHFWAMPVYNYAENKIQILEITQKGIQKKIKAYARDEDWGSPVNYDLVVTRSGQSLETEYEVIAKPAKELDIEIAKQYAAMTINLEALYAGDDPFKDAGDVVAEANENFAKATNKS